MTTIDDVSRSVQTIYNAAVGPRDWAVALEAISVAMGASICSLVASDLAATRSPGTICGDWERQ
jgi:hypothetical protein